MLDDIIKGSISKILCNKQYITKSFIKEKPCGNEWVMVNTENTLWIFAARFIHIGICKVVFLFLVYHLAILLLIPYIE